MRYALGDSADFEQVLEAAATADQRRSADPSYAVVCEPTSSKGIVPSSFATAYEPDVAQFALKRTRMTFLSYSASVCSVISTPPAA